MLLVMLSDANRMNQNGLASKKNKLVQKKKCRPIAVTLSTLRHDKKGFALLVYDKGESMTSLISFCGQLSMELRQCFRAPTPPPRLSTPLL
jgi:hypothetical protein